MGNAGLRRLWKQLFQQGGRDGTFFLAVSLPPFHKHCQIMYCSELEHEERRALEKKYWVLKMVHMYTHFKCKLFSTRRYETYFRTDASQLEPTEWLRGFLLWSALSSPLPSTQGSWTSGDSCSSMLMTLALFSPGTLFIYIYIYTCIYIYIYTHTYTHTHTQIQNLSLHFHKFGQICLTPNKTQDVPIIPEISLQQLFSLNFPPQNSHCCDFSHHQFLYALLELHINRIIQYVIFCVCGFFYTTFSFWDFSQCATYQ